MDEMESITLRLEETSALRRIAIPENISQIDREAIVAINTLIDGGFVLIDAGGHSYKVDNSNPETVKRLAYTLSLRLGKLCTITTG